MKKHLLIICSCLMMAKIMMAQGSVAQPKTDTLFVIDGNVVDNVKSVKPDSIADLTILNVSNPANVFCGPDRTVCVITTLNSATKSYQKKLSAFSKKYKQFLISNNNKDDNNVSYSLNGENLPTKERNTICKLYSLKLKELKTVSVVKKEMRGYFYLAYYNIYITTKN